jgi:hypothetical protein
VRGVRAVAWRGVAWRAWRAWRGAVAWRGVACWCSRAVWTRCAQAGYKVTDSDAPRGSYEWRCACSDMGRQLPAMARPGVRLAVESLRCQFQLRLARHTDNRLVVTAGQWRHTCKPGEGSYKRNLGPPAALVASTLPSLSAIPGQGPGPGPGRIRHTVASLWQLSGGPGAPSKDVAYRAAALVVDDAVDSLGFPDFGYVRPALCPLAGHESSPPHDDSL